MPEPLTPERIEKWNAWLKLHQFKKKAEHILLRHMLKAGFTKEQALQMIREHQNQQED